jgi:hypothetical protein
MRKLTEKDVTFSVSVEQDDIPVRGNAVASGDDRFDKECEDEILNRLRRNDVWAWARVTVTATWNRYTGHAGLGACSYKDEAEFREPGGYYDDMKQEALDALNAELALHAEALSELSEDVTGAA